MALGAFLHYLYVGLCIESPSTTRVRKPTEKDYLTKYGDVAWLWLLIGELSSSHGVSFKVEPSDLMYHKTFTVSKGDVWQAKVISSFLIKENPELVERILREVTLWVFNTHLHLSYYKSKPEVCD